jgi:hypothetical protein
MIDVLLVYLLPDLVALDAGPGLLEHALVHLSSVFMPCLQLPNDVLLRGDYLL